MRKIAVFLLTVVLTGCVHQFHLDEWVGKPVEALDTHPLFLTMRLQRSFTANGAIEIRNYVNEGDMLIPFGGMMMQKRVGCHNIFYISEGYVMEYRPTPSGGARCKTGEPTRPEWQWR